MLLRSRHFQLWLARVLRRLAQCIASGHQGDFEQEVGGYFRTGKLKNKETVAKGIDKAVGAFIGLFQGQNIGKMVVQLA